MLKVAPTSRAAFRLLPVIDRLGVNDWYQTDTLISRTTDAKARRILITGPTPAGEGSIVVVPTVEQMWGRPKATGPGLEKAKLTDMIRYLMYKEDGVRDAEEFLTERAVWSDGRYHRRAWSAVWSDGRWVEGAALIAWGSCSPLDMATGLVAIKAEPEPKDPAVTALGKAFRAGRASGGV